MPATPVTATPVTIALDAAVDELEPFMSTPSPGSLRVMKEIIARHLRPHIVPQILPASEDVLQDWNIEEPHYIAATTDGSCMAGPTDARWRIFAHRKIDNNCVLATGDTKEEALAAVQARIRIQPNDTDTLFMQQLRGLLQYEDVRPAIDLCRVRFGGRALQSVLTLLAEHFDAIAVVLSGPCTLEEIETAKGQAEASAAHCRRLAVGNE